MYKRQAVYEDELIVVAVKLFAKNASPPTPTPPVTCNAPDVELVALVAEVKLVSLVIVPPEKVALILATAVLIRVGTKVVSIVLKLLRALLNASRMLSPDPSFAEAPILIVSKLGIF